MPKQTQSSSLTRAQITKSKRQGFVTVVSPYDKRYVENLKFSIPYPHRQWNVNDKTWDVSETYLEELIKLLKLYYDDVSTDLIQHESVNDNPFVEVLKLVAKDDLDKVYKALAFAVHPDRGGTEESMKRLTEAYEEAKQ